MSDHSRRHRLRADDRDPDALFTVRYSERLGERDCRMLGRGIRGVADLAQEPRGRGHTDEVSPASFDHARQQGASGVDMRHDVDVPASLPPVLDRNDAAIPGCRVPVRITVADARVGYEQINRPDVTFKVFDQRLDGRLVSDVDNPGNTANISSHVRGRIRLELGDDYLDAVARQAFAKCTANTVAASGNDGNIDFDSHSFLAAAVGRLRSCASPQCSNILYAQEVVQ
jgi:hypothetical protein